MKKEYIIPTVKVQTTDNDNFICLSMIGDEGDGEQLTNEGMFDNDFNAQQNPWDN